MDAGSPEILARTALRASREPAAAASGSTSASRTRASSSAKNGFPPDRSWMRSNVWRANGLPSRSRRSRWSAPTLSGPDRQPLGRAPRRAPARAPTAALRRQAAGRAAREPGSPPSLRSANASALDEDGSSHWTSSTATRSGPRSLRSCSASRTATRERTMDRRDQPTPPRGAAQPRARAVSAPTESGSTSSRTSSNRSPSPTWARPRSASAGRDERTRNPALARVLDAG